MFAVRQSRALSSELIVRKFREEQLLDLRAVSARIQLFKQRVLPATLNSEPVVQELLRGVGTSLFQATADPIVAARLTGELDADSFARPRDLTYSDFQSFASTLRTTLLEMPVSSPPMVPIELPQVRINEANIATAQRNFNEALVYYFDQYFRNKYVDRFGTPVNAPNVLQTITDNEIAGTVTVFLELVMDYAFQTPIWFDKDKQTYLPGSGTSKNPPTAVGGNLVPVLNLQPSTTDQQTEACGITALKAKAIQFIATTAGTRASSLAGTVGGSFGGINIGLGVLGKLSIGDNKTLQTLAKTSLALTFNRAGEEASYRVLYMIGYRQSEVSTLLQMIQVYLNAQLVAPLKS